MSKIHSYTIMCAPTTPQVAALEALRQGSEARDRMIAEYDQRRRLVVRRLNDIGLSCFWPRGAFYAFPSIQTTGLSSDEFSRALVEDLEPVREADQIRPLAHDVVGQPVQGPHAHPHARDQAARAQEARHPRREVVHRGIDQGHDEHLLVLLEHVRGHELGS
jgi:aminotransferase